MSITMPILNYRVGRNVKVIMFYVIASTLFLSLPETKACDQKFEGFGVFLGSNQHFSRSKPGVEERVLQVVYDFLGIRHFRTSYEDTFSPEQDIYEIKCTDERSFTCSWINAHRYLSNFSDVKVFASVWSPPHYMKNDFYQLLPEYETTYLYFLKNITQILKHDYNITIEKISPVNEPENLFAPWDHTNMTPDQLCRIIRMYNDPMISVCPENSYFWVSRIYYNFESEDPNVNCSAYCDVHATHAYSLNWDLSSDNSLLAYYDLKPYTDRGTTAPIWMTEVSSTYRNSDVTQMEEALDLAMNIINFLGSTCVQRYYYWYMYTLGFSGESLIWGDNSGNLYFPKKFFIYKLFVNASNTIKGPVEVNSYNPSVNSTSGSHTQETLIVENLGCLQFGDVDRVLVNKEAVARQVDNMSCSSVCCTTEIEDFNCNENSSTSQTIPPKSVCHCVLQTPVVLTNSIIV